MSVGQVVSYKLVGQLDYLVFGQLFSIWLVIQYLVSWSSLLVSYLVFGQLVQFVSQLFSIWLVIQYLVSQSSLLVSYLVQLLVYSFISWFVKLVG